MGGSRQGAERNAPPHLDVEIPILIPAAGASRRMRGADKLLESVNGVALLRHQALTALDVGVPVLVTLPNDSPARHQCLRGLPVQIVTVPDPTEGMAASIRAGIGALPDAARAVMILLADLPDITAADLTAMLAAFRNDPTAPILRACSADSTPGHPVIFPRRHFSGLAALTGDAGARDLLAHAPNLRAFPLPGTHATTDLDTPEAWAAWHDRRVT